MAAVPDVWPHKGERGHVRLCPPAHTGPAILHSELVRSNPRALYTFCLHNLYTQILVYRNKLLHTLTFAGGQTDRQTTSFIEISIDAGILTHAHAHALATMQRPTHILLTYTYVRA